MTRHRTVPKVCFVFLPLASLSAAVMGGTETNVKVLESAKPPSPVVELVRQATSRYKDVQVAVDDGYAAGPCVSGPNGGAMGIHFINGALVADGAVDVTRPESLIYEPLPSGQFRLVGVEYITLAPTWDAANEAPPILEGHLFQFVGSPNRYRLPAFYELHVWAWKENPDGTFADWNPNVSCDAHDPDLLQTSH